MRGAAKYLDAEDNELLIRTATLDGFLLKRVARKLPVGATTSRYHLEWCELKGRTLYYTRRDAATGDSVGFTKKLRLGARARVLGAGGFFFFRGLMGLPSAEALVVA